MVYGLKQKESTHKISILTAAHINKDENLFIKLLAAYMLIKNDGKENLSLRSELQKYIYLDFENRSDPYEIDEYINEARNYIHTNRDEDVDNVVDAVAHILKDNDEFQNYSTNFLDQRKQKAIYNTKKFLWFALPSFGLSLIIGIPAIWIRYKIEEKRDAQQLEALKVESSAITTEPESLDRDLYSQLSTDETPPSSNKTSIDDFGKTGKRKIFIEESGEKERQKQGGSAEQLLQKKEK